MRGVTVIQNDHTNSGITTNYSCANDDDKRRQKKDKLASLEAKLFRLGLAMRLFLLMRIDAHQMRIDGHEPHH